MGKSPLSRAEAEKAGWIIVHEDEEGGSYRAERYLDSNTKIEAAGATEGLLLEAINARHEFEDSIEQPPPPEPSNLDAAKVVATPLGELTEEEWSLRDSGYEPAAEAEEARREQAQQAEDEAKADPRGEIDTEQVVVESQRDHQLQDVLIVHSGEETLDDVVDRKLEQTAQAESDRADAGLGIGPYETDEDGEPVPMGGQPELFDPADLPDGVPATEQAMAEEHQAAIDAAEQTRDEEGKAADKPEAQTKTAEARTEAVQGAKDEAEEGPDATPAAAELADEHGIDLNEVEGTGEGGKITKPDVQAAVDAQEE